MRRKKKATNERGFRFGAKSAFICVPTACLCLCPSHRLAPVDLALDDQASAALLAFAVAVVVEVAHVAVQPVAAAVAHVAPVAVGPAAQVDSAPERVRVAFVVVAAAAEQLRVVAVVARAAVAAVELVLRHVRPAAVVVAPVALLVQLAALLPHVLSVAAPSVVVAAVARCAAVRVAQHRCHAQLVALVEQPVAAMLPGFAPFVVHRVPVARLSPETSGPSHDRVRCSRADPSPDSDGTAVLLVLCS